jgi:hypothetical protein
MYLVTAKKLNIGVLKLTPASLKIPSTLSQQTAQPVEKALAEYTKGNTNLTAERMIRYSATIIVADLVNSPHFDSGDPR